MFSILNYLQKHHLVDLLFPLQPVTTGHVVQVVVNALLPGNMMMVRVLVILILLMKFMLHERGSNRDWRQRRCPRLLLLLTRRGGERVRVNSSSRRSCLPRKRKMGRKCLPQGRRVVANRIGRKKPVWIDGRTRNCMKHYKNRLLLIYLNEG